MKLQAVKRDNDQIYGYKFWCPACRCTHVFRTEKESLDGKPRPTWSFNGDMDSPSFTPSMVFFEEENGVRKTICHFYVTKGVIDYCSDSPHEFRGKKIPLGDIPENWL